MTGAGSARSFCITMMDWQLVDRLTSAKNPQIRFARSLKSERQAKKAGCLIAEGLRQVETSLLHIPAEYILFEDSLQGQQAFQALQNPLKDYRGEQVRRVSPEVFAGLGETRHSQAVLAIFQTPSLQALTELVEPQRGRFILLEECRDPGNLGTIIRTAEAMGFDGLILAGHCVWPFNGKVLRAAMGSIFYLPLYLLSDWREAEGCLNHYTWLCADLAGDHLPDWRPDSEAAGFVLVLGNEAHGLSPAAKAACEFSLTIPMQGRAESYNLAISAAIMSYALSARYGFLD